MLDPQLAELSGKDQEAWSCWRRCVPWIGLEVSNVRARPTLSLLPADRDVKALVSVPACLPPTMLPAMMAAD